MFQEAGNILMIVLSLTGLDSIQFVVSLCFMPETLRILQSLTLCVHFFEMTLFETNVN